MEVCFLILNPDGNYIGLKNTIGSIKLRSFNRDYICAVGQNTGSKELKEMKELCPTFKGKNTITSLINTGFKKIKKGWVCIVFSGSRIPAGIEKKWSLFCKNENDVLYPIVEKKYNFVEGSFNGVLINTDFFNKCGDFPDHVMQKQGLNDFEFAKLLWSFDALKNGACFKGIIGMKVI